MFTGFTDETVDFFMDLKFHNNTTFFHEHHERYIENVQKPFYALINELSEDMRSIDPMMEIRPSHCISRIHKDTRFTKDKSPYRDHLWFLFRKGGEPREKSLNYFFEFGANTLGWGMGFWGENRPALDLFRREMLANPEKVQAVLEKSNLSQHDLIVQGSMHKRMPVPEQLPSSLVNWYLIKEVYICKDQPDPALAFTPELADRVREDFLALAPLYRLLRGYYDETMDQL